MAKPVTMRLSVGLVFLFVCVGVPEIHSQTLPREIIFERVTIPGTIRSSQVTDIIQDQSGMVWLTGAGLYQYDGNRFRQYREFGGGKEFLTPQDLLFLLNDTVTDRILLGTRRFGVVSYKHQDDQLTSLPVSGTTPIINHLAQTKDGNVWAASFPSGLYQIQQDSLKKVPDPEKLFLHPGSLIAAGSKLFIGEVGKVVVFENGKVTDQIPLNWQGKNLPFYTQVTALHCGKDQKLWIGTEKQGVLVYDLVKKMFIKYFSPSRTPFFNKITRIHQDRDGWVWMLTKASGCVVYNPAEDRMLHLTKDPFSTQSLSSDNCFSIMEDRQGIIWIGATGDINKYDRKQIKFTHINHNPPGKLSLTDNMIRGVHEDHEGKIWIGTDGGYINVLDLQKESIQHLKVALEKDSVNYVPLYFLELNDRIMLVGTSLGLLQYDRAAKTFSPYKPLLSFTLQKKTIRQLLRHENTLYFIYNGILFMHNMSTGETEQFRDAGDSEAVNITAIHLDKKHRLWVGSSKGISLFNPASKTFKLIPFRKMPVGVDGSLLLVLSIEHVGDKIYAGTFNSGLWEVDIRDVETSFPKLKNYTEQHGLPSNTVYSALDDSEGNLWLSTNGGLTRFEPGNAAIYFFRHQ
jgi:ligand-binding sensor domain-containing protein